MASERTWHRVIDGKLAWIRQDNGRLVVTTGLLESDRRERAERELTRSERIAWRLTRRAPKI